MQTFRTVWSLRNLRSDDKLGHCDGKILRFKVDHRLQVNTF